MCAGCMNVVDLIHNDEFIPDGELVMEFEQFIRKTITPPVNEVLVSNDIGVLMIICGARLLNWRPQQNG